MTTRTRIALSVLVLGAVAGAAFGYSRHVENARLAQAASARASLLYCLVGSAAPSAEVLRAVELGAHAERAATPEQPPASRSEADWPRRCAPRSRRFTDAVRWRAPAVHAAAAALTRALWHGEVTTGLEELAVATADWGDAPHDAPEPPAAQQTLSAARWDRTQCRAVGRSAWTIGGLEVTLSCSYDRTCVFDRALEEATCTQSRDRGDEVPTLDGPGFRIEVEGAEDRRTRSAGDSSSILPVSVVVDGAERTPLGEVSYQRGFELEACVAGDNAFVRPHSGFDFADDSLAPETTLRMFLRSASTWRAEFITLRATEDIVVACSPARALDLVSTVPGTDTLLIERVRCGAVCESQRATLGPDVLEPPVDGFYAMRWFAAPIGDQVLFVELSAEPDAETHGARDAHDAQAFGVRYRIADVDALDQTLPAYVLDPRDGLYLDGETSNALLVSNGDAAIMFFSDAGKGVVALRFTADASPTALIVDADGIREATTR